MERALLEVLMRANRRMPVGGDAAAPRRAQARYAKRGPLIHGRPWLFAVALFVFLGCDAAPSKDVRYEPSPMPVVRAMLELADVGPGDIVYDLGSGDGRIPITAARERGARGVGVDIDPDLIRIARENARDAGVANRVTFIEGDMYRADLRPASVVTLFLHPEPNLKLRPILKAQLKPGSRVVSYVWDMGDWPPDQVRTINDRKIYLWTIPGENKRNPSPRRR